MLRTFFIICLIGWLSLVSMPNMAWANSSPTHMQWLAQAKTEVQLMPSNQPNSEQPNSEAFTETVPSPATSSPAQSEAKSKSAQQASPDQPSAKQTSQDKPFNPYDMEALKQFDQGSHRAT